MGTCYLKQINMLCYVMLCYDKMTYQVDISYEGMNDT